MWSWHEAGGPYVPFWIILGTRAPLKRMGHVFAAETMQSASRDKIPSAVGGWHRWMKRQWCRQDIHKRSTEVTGGPKMKFPLAAMRCWMHWTGQKAFSWTWKVKMQCIMLFWLCPSRWWAPGEVQWANQVRKTTSQHPAYPELPQSCLHCYTLTLTLLSPAVWPWQLILIPFMASSVLYWFQVGEDLSGWLRHT